MGLTDVLATWGAGLSTLVAAREIWSARDRLKVRVHLGAGGGGKGACAVVWVSNPGRRPVMVQYFAYAWPFQTIAFRERVRHFIRYRHYWPIIGWCRTALSSGLVEDCHLPQLLDPGHSLQIWVPFDRIGGRDRTESTRVVFQVQDALGRNYYSPEFSVPPKRAKPKKIDAP